MRNNKGMSLVAVIFIMLVGAVITLLLNNIFSSKSATSANEYLYNKAFFIAEAGRAYTVKKLALIPDWSTGTSFPYVMNFAGGRFLVASNALTSSSVNIRCTGVFTFEGVTYTRVVESTVSRGGGSGSILGTNTLYSYLAGIGDRTTNIGANATIVGDITANSNIALGNNSRVNGSAHSSGAITGGTVTAERDAYSTEQIVTPEIDVTYYQNLINLAGTYPAGNRTYSGTNTLSGRIFVNGNVNINTNTNIWRNSSSPSVEIICTGAVIGGYNININSNIRFIAGGNISFSGNINFGTGDMLFSLLPTNTITIGSNNNEGSSGAGNGVVILTPGNVTINDNVNFYGLIFAENTIRLGSNVNMTGSILGGFIDSIGANAVLRLTPNSVNFSTLIGVSGSTGIAIGSSNWHEAY